MGGREKNFYAKQKNFDTILKGVSGNISDFKISFNDYKRDNLKKRRGVTRFSTRNRFPCIVLLWARISRRAYRVEERNG